MKSAANGFARLRPARQAADGADQGRHVRDQAEARKKSGGQEARRSRPTSGCSARRGAEAACADGPAQGHRRRSLSMVAKGYYRTLGGASTATARNATFVTTDRCDGTLTEVGKGRVSLASRAAKKPVVVQARRRLPGQGEAVPRRKGKRPLA